MDQVLIDRAGSVATLWLNRPELHNAFDDRLIRAFQCLFELFLGLSLRQQFVHCLQTEHQPVKTL